MARRSIRSMSDEELRRERRSLAGTVTRWAGDRYRRICDEELRREEGIEPAPRRSRRDDVREMLDRKRD